MDHLLLLIWPSELFLTTIILRFRLYCTQVAGQFSIVSPPSPMKQMTWRLGWATAADNWVRQTAGHRGKRARAGEFHPAAAARRPGGDDARIRCDNCVVA